MKLTRPLLLASTSPARRELLARLGLPFEVVAPDYDEIPLPELSPVDLALHHAVGKARAVAATRPDRVVIGSDQVAELDGALLGKPGTPEAAAAQLTRMAGRAVNFHTGLAVIGGGREDAAAETFRVHLRALSAEEIASYVAVEKPFGCAGSFRIEGLGIALMERLEGADYTALIGLPLILLTTLLRRIGLNPLADDP